MSYMQEANAIAARLRSSSAPHRPSRSGCHARTTASPVALDVLAFMRRFFAENDQLPPLSAISKAFGWASDQTGHGHVNTLLRFGHLERNAVGRWRFARAPLAANAAYHAKEQNDA